MLWLFFRYQTHLALPVCGKPGILPRHFRCPSTKHEKAVELSMYTLAQTLWAKNRYFQQEELILISRDSF